MRSLWLVAMLLCGVGCQSLPSGSRLVHTSGPMPPIAMAGSMPGRPGPKESPRLVLVPPKSALNGEAQPGASWVVDLPEDWDAQARPTVVVVPVPVDRSKTPDAETVASKSPAEPELPKPEPEPQTLAKATADDQLLQRLQTIESAVQTLVNKVDQVERTSTFRVVNAPDLPYQVGFAK